ncbi:40S ribosomal protein S7-like [Panthera tigris]|uniref:40S ribosomal protein S7-like n=1 Tax=Panthera tigris TaxID=9694 RepID=UPI001C6F80BD|nr:40S ribosomal protein S7-like [Panthera tigris]
MNNVTESFVSDSSRNSKLLLSNSKELAMLTMATEVRRLNAFLKAEREGDTESEAIWSFQKIQVRVVRELEKKFSGKHVVFIAQKRILPKPARKSHTKNQQKRPRNCTLTAVHDAILEDLVFPSEIMGKRIRVKLDSSRLIKVHLDKAQQNNVEHKVETFSGVYKKLTGKDVNFEFPEFQL